MAGTSYKEVYKHAQFVFKQIESKTKRKPYIRSPYFGKRKVFWDNFWIHLNQKPSKMRKSRLIFLSCAIELVQKSKIKPETKPNPNKRTELLHRFSGISANGEAFRVQIKENTSSKTLQIMSVFPK